MLVALATALGIDAKGGDHKADAASGPPWQKMTTALPTADGETQRWCCGWW